MALASIVLKAETGTQMSGKKGAGQDWTLLLCRTKENSGTEISQAEIVDKFTVSKSSREHTKITLVRRQLIYLLNIPGYIVLDVL